MDTVIRMGHTSETRYAEIVLVLCITSIVLTAPVGAIIITLAGPRLLTKTIPGPPEGWRRTGARPSLRDISIIDEEPENESSEEKGDNRTMEQAHQLPPNIVVTTQPT